jgi:amino-acid N-acetyltransferase
MSITFRTARVADGQAIYELVNAYAQRGAMLPRSRSAVYQNIRDFVVAEEEGQIVGCGALQITWADLAEVRSLAVADGRQGQGIGTAIVRTLLREARDLGLPQVFALTYQTDFFLQLGFHSIDKDALPQKIWADCIDCVKFPNCDEEAVIIRLEEG